MACERRFVTISALYLRGFMPCLAQSVLAVKVPHFIFLAWAEEFACQYMQEERTHSHTHGGDVSNQRSLNFYSRKSMVSKRTISWGRRCDDYLVS